MKLTMRPIVLIICLLFVSPLHSGPAQNSPPKGDDVAIVEFKDLLYPIPAQIGRHQGSVVVQVKLDDHGKVSDATAILGHPYLAIAAVANVKQWRFRPNASESAIIVYNFIFIEGRCESHGSLFVLEPSNRATVIGCSAAVNPSASR